jgi:probable HAF family extracellular repeat protein
MRRQLSEFVPALCQDSVSLACRSTRQAGGLLVLLALGILLSSNLVLPADAASLSFTPLGDFPGGTFQGRAFDVSADGAVFVGWSTSASGQEAFRWTSGGGMQNLRDLLIAGGVTGLTNWTLTEAKSISADGLTIVGVGINPLGQAEAWIATIPEPSSLVLAGCAAVGLLSVARRRTRRRADFDN